MGLELEQVVAALAAIRRCATVEHQPFATAVHRVVQQGLQRGLAGGLVLRHGLQRGVLARQGVAESGDACVERARFGRQVEDHVAQPAPSRVVGQVACSSRGGVREAAVAGPQLAIHRLGRPAAGEPRRRVDAVAVARPEGLAVPVGAHAVVLLADPPALQGHAWAIDTGQHQGAWAARVGGLRQEGRGAERQQQRAANEVEAW